MLAHYTKMLNIVAITLVSQHTSALGKKWLNRLVLGFQQLGGLIKLGTQDTSIRL